MNGFYQTAYTAALSVGNKAYTQVTAMGMEPEDFAGEVIERLLRRETEKSFNAEKVGGNLVGYIKMCSKRILIDLHRAFERRIQAESLNTLVQGTAESFIDLIEDKNSQDMFVLHDLYFSAPTERINKNIDTTWRELFTMCFSADDASTAECLGVNQKRLAQLKRQLNQRLTAEA